MTNLIHLISCMNDDAIIHNKVIKWLPFNFVKSAFYFGIRVRQFISELRLLMFFLLSNFFDEKYSLNISFWPQSITYHFIHLPKKMCIDLNNPNMRNRRKSNTSQARSWWWWWKFFLTIRKIRIFLSQNTLTLCQDFLPHLFTFANSFFFAKRKFFKFLRSLINLKSSWVAHIFGRLSGKQKYFYFLQPPSLWLI